MRSVRRHHHAHLILTLAAIAFVSACQRGPAAAGPRDATTPTPASRAARIVASWRLPVTAPEAPQLVSAMARCGDEFFLVDRRLAIVYQTKFDGSGRRIGRQGDGEGAFREPTGIAVDCAASTIYVVDTTGISLFRTDSGAFIRRFPRPRGFANRGASVLIDPATHTLEASGVWPRDINGDWMGRDAASVHEGAHFGLSLDVASGNATPLFNPVALACGNFSYTCWESTFDRIDDPSARWVFAQAQSGIVALISAQGQVVRRIRVGSAQFRADGHSVSPSAPLAEQLAWGERNSRIERVFGVGQRLAIVHSIQTTRNWKVGEAIQFAAYLNIYTVEGTPVECDISLPGLPVGRDAQYLYVVDYGESGRQDGAPARLCAIGLDK